VIVDQILKALRDGLDKVLGRADRRLQEGTAFTPEVAARILYWELFDKSGEWREKGETRASGE